MLLRLIPPYRYISEIGDGSEAQASTSKLAWTLHGVLVLVIALNFGCTLPSDAKLERMFRDHKAAFEELVSMARENDQIVSISSTFVVIPDKIIQNPESASERDWAACSRYGLSKERYNRYRQMFHILGIHMIGREHGQLSFSAEPTYENYFVKGFVYSESELYPCVQDLDRYRRSNEARETRSVVYKRLALHWYLYMAPS